MSNSVTECIIDGCHKPKHVRAGYCSMHHYRVKKYGSPELPGVFCDCGEKLPERSSPSSRCEACARKRRNEQQRDRKYWREWSASNKDKVHANYRKYYESNKDKYIDRTRARRARLRGVESEKYTSLEIHDRDGWVCQICLLPIDRDLKHPDPMSKSIDHIVATINGGTDTKDNVRSAHLSCNSRKGAEDRRVYAQGRGQERN